MPKISTTKPSAPPSGRFDQAKSFATGEKPEEKKEERPTLRPSKNGVETRRENFDIPVDLGDEMLRFIIDNKQKFKTKRDFLIQCVRDGLAKYGDK